MPNHPLDDAPPNELSGTVGGASSEGMIPPRRSMSRRIIRGGVWLGVAGFMVTLIGAVLLGNGPSQFEALGESVHRVGMFMMLGGFITLLVGYRWDALGAFFEPPADRATGVLSEPLRERTLRELFDSFPPPPAPPMVDAELAQTRPATDPTADSLGRTRSDDRGSILTAQRFSSDIATQPPPSVHTWGCLISAWSVIGIVFVIVGVLYWIVPTRHAILLSLLLDMALVVVSLASAVAWPRRKRAFALGGAVPLVTMVIAKYPLIQSSAMIPPWGGGMFGNYPPSWEWRAVDLGFHLLVPLTGFLGWLVVRSLDALDASQATRKDRSR